MEPINWDHKMSTNIGVHLQANRIQTKRTSQGTSIRLLEASDYFNKIPATKYKALTQS